MLKRFAFGVRTVMASSTAPPHTLPGGALLHQDSRGPEAMEDHGCPDVLTFHLADRESDPSHRRPLGCRVASDERPPRTH